MTGWSAHVHGVTGPLYNIFRAGTALDRQKKTGQPEFFAVRRFGRIVAHLPAGQIGKSV